MSKTTLDEILSNYAGRLETYKKVHQGLPESVTHDKAYAADVTKQAILRWVADEVIGEPLKDDVTYTPTLEDPYGRRHLMDTTKTSVQKTHWNYGSVETVKRQYRRLAQHGYKGGK